MGRGSTRLAAERPERERLEVIEPPSGRAGDSCLEHGHAGSFGCPAPVRVRFLPHTLRLTTAGFRIALLGLPVGRPRLGDRTRTKTTAPGVCAGAFRQRRVCRHHASGPHQSQQPVVEPRALTFPLLVRFHSAGQLAAPVDRRGEQRDQLTREPHRPTRGVREQFPVPRRSTWARHDWWTACARTGRRCRTRRGRALPTSPPRSLAPGRRALRCESMAYPVASSPTHTWSQALCPPTRHPVLRRPRGVSMSGSTPGCAGTWPQAGCPTDCVDLGTCPHAKGRSRTGDPNTAATLPWDSPAWSVQQGHRGLGVGADLTGRRAQRASDVWSGCRPWVRRPQSVQCPR